MATANLFTLCQIYNATEQRLTSGPGKNHDWYGGFGGNSIRETLDNGEWGWFIHLGSVVPPGARSSGAIIYQGQTADGSSIDWIVAWDNPLHSPQKVYTLVRPHAASPIDWTWIWQNLCNSRSESTSSHGGLYARVSIADGNFPVLQAILSPNGAGN